MIGSHSVAEIKSPDIIPIINIIHQREESLFPDSRRALRRHHLARLKRVRAKYRHAYANVSPRVLGIVVTTPCICSCYMCGNVRKFHGRSIQEKRHALASPAVHGFLVDL